MRKRFILLMVTVLLAVLPVLHASAESALMQKLDKQLKAGSGLSGTVTASGISGLSGLSMDVQYVLQKVQSQLMLSLKNGQAELLKAVVYNQEGKSVLDAGLASRKLYSFTGGWEAVAGLIGGTGLTANKPSITPFVIDMLMPSGDASDASSLADAAAPYFTKLELWMQGFAAPPALEKDANDNSVMKVAYSIPATALKAEIKQLLVDLLADEKLLPLLWEKMTKEQADLYVNPALQGFYFQAVDALPLEGIVSMNRSVTTAGQHIETSISFPMSSSGSSLKNVTYVVKTADGGDVVNIKLDMLDGSLEFSMQAAVQAQADTSSYQGLIRYLPGEVPNWQVDSTTPKYTGKALSFTYKAGITTKIAIDADGKNNELYALAIELTPDWSHLTQTPTDEVKAQYILTEPANITASAALLSGQARNASTSIQAQFRFVSGAVDWKLDAQGKTTPPWAFEPVDVNAAEDLASLNADQLNGLLMEILGRPSLLQLVQLLIPSEQQTPGPVG